MLERFNLIRQVSMFHVVEAVDRYAITPRVDYRQGLLVVDIQILGVGRVLGKFRSIGEMRSMPGQ